MGGSAFPITTHFRRKTIMFNPVIRSRPTVLLFCLLISIGSNSLLVAEDEGRILPAPQSGKTMSCRTQIEFQGKVVLFASDDEQDKQLDLKVLSSQEFDQIAIDDDHFLRKYQQASANIQIDGNKTQSVLSEGNRQIALRHLSADSVRPIQYFSTGGVLRQAEKDLLSAPADTVGLQRLLTTENLSKGSQWKPQDHDVQSFLSLENVIDNRVLVTVKELDQATAKLYVTGEALGEVDGAKTHTRVVGVAIFDLKNQIVTAFRGTLSENRDASQLAPGFIGAVKIDATCKLKQDRDLSDAGIAKVKDQIAEHQTMRLLWDSESEFELIYDPNWKVILSDPEVVIMRYAQRGNLLAQCNVLRLPKRPADRPLQLNEFREQLERTVLGETGARVNGAQVLKTTSGLNALQVVVTGVQEQVPIHWVYYHLSNSEGRCVAVVVTIEDALLPVFDKADLKLLESIRFTERKSQARGASPSVSR
jgi:hypothetical protein